MSFMFNPYPYDDPKPVNRPKLSEDTVNSIISGTKEVASSMSSLFLDKLNENPNEGLVVALDGYISAQWDQVVNLLTQSLKTTSAQVQIIDFSKMFKPAGQLDDELLEYLPEDRVTDPVLLFGKLFDGKFEDLLDKDKVNELVEALKISQKKAGQITIVFGCGCTIELLRSFYDYVFYFDVTPKTVILRARNGFAKNLGDYIAKPIKALLRRFYYVDFEVVQALRWDLLKTNAIDFYIASDNPEQIKMLPLGAFNDIMDQLVKYPMRCKPVYLEGVWGGYYIKRLRNLPEEMKNCAWVFDMIPMEVSIVVEAGNNKVEFPFFTFVQKKGIELMGEPCVDKFGGYFPIRFNYDDSWHSNGNMSIQVHSDGEYNIEHYNELGRQDESYYIIEVGHGAKTYVGFNEDIDVDDFIAETKKSEKEGTPIDYKKYVNHIESKPGIQVMLPAGTIHSSGRNQVILEIGSLTVGSYTYKMYDYLRKDLDGVPRPIHTYHGERVLRKERTTSWVNDNLIQDPQLIREGNGWSEYIIGEHDLLYISMRRLEFENEIEDNTKGKFHVLTLVDGEKVIIESVDNPELFYIQEYFDVIVVPASIGKYRIRNLGNQPVCIHKTMLKDGFENDGK